MIAFFSKLFSRPQPAILEARARDSAALSAIHGDSFPVGWSEEEFDQLIADHSVIAHLARSEGGRGPIVGFLMSRIAADEAEILTVAVSPSERGRGLAGQLLHRHLGRLAALGIAQVFLEVGEDNGSALHLYDKAGFRQVGQRAAYYPRPEGPVSALTLRRDLI